MNIYQFLVILNARKWVALLVLVATIASVTVISFQLPKKYVATSSLVINYSGGNPLTGSKEVLPGYMATQIDIMGSQNVAVNVVKKLNLYTNPSYIRSYNAATHGQLGIQEWIAKLISHGLIIIPSKQSNVIQIGYESTDPEFSAAMANAFAEAYINTNLEMKIQPSRRTANWFKTQVEELRKDLIAKQEALSSYQREKQIVSIDERFDVENKRLSQLSQQLVQAQGELFSAQSQLAAINKGNINDLDLINDSLVRDLQLSLSKKEVQLDELKQRVSSKHPDYISVMAEVQSLKRKLVVEIRSAKNRVQNAVNIASQRVDELTDAVAKQKQVLLSINEDRNKLDILKRDMDTAEKIFTMATQRLQETSLEGELNESDASILTPATVPLNYSKPKIPLMIMLSVFLGLILAVAVVFLLEFINRKIRTVEDLKALELPVLGVLAYSKGLGGN